MRKAAERAFVTPQCLSDHIKRLEKTYGVPLFTRKPSLKLTPAGELLLEAVYQMQTVENDLENTMNEIKGGTSGTINLGFNSSRARVILPRVLPQYSREYPNILLTVRSDDTRNMEEMLIKGDLDLFIGINTATNPMFQKDQICTEDVYFIMTDQLMRQYELEDYPACIQRYKTGIRLTDIEKYPVIRNLRNSTLSKLINDHANRDDILFHTVLSTSDYDTQIQLVGINYAAAFCPSLLLKRVEEANRIRVLDQQIYMFPLLGLEKALRNEFIYHKGIRCPNYLRRFMQLTKDTVNYSLAN